MKTVYYYLGTLFVLATVLLSALLLAHTDGQRTILGTDAILLIGAYLLSAALAWRGTRKAACKDSEKPTTWLYLVVGPLIVGLVLVAFFGWNYPSTGGWLGGWFAVGAAAVLGAAELVVRLQVKTVALVVTGFLALGFVFALLFGHEYLLALHSSF
jgi:hypothetical protein